jgi:hypothetical protein
LVKHLSCSSHFGLGRLLELEFSFSHVETEMNLLGRITEGLHETKKLLYNEVNGHQEKNQPTEW